MPENNFDSNQRYFPDTLRVGDAEIKHFTPVNGLVDRFGNRIFRSGRLIYTDRSRSSVRAALLVSHSGKELISSSPRILRDIDRGLGILEVDKTAELAPGRKLERWKGGSQSRVNLLTVDGQKKVIKTQSSSLYSQPFINEMLQVQSLQTDLGDQLDQFNVEMPTFLFASGQVSCVEFAEGEEAVEDDLRPFVGKLYRIIDNYVKDQNHDGNKLWRGVFIDLMKFYPTTQIRANNFVKRPNGSLVWIDPFFFS
jgi:hypothetical protein